MNERDKERKMEVTKEQQIGIEQRKRDENMTRANEKRNKDSKKEGGNERRSDG
jgi:hypothetical protein